MPNNPLYPGYSEKKKGSDQSNPLYPGYYTGQPISRRPQSKNYLKPVEFDFDTLTEGIDNAAEKVKHSPINFPRWVWERIVDDTKSSFEASIRPKGMKVAELDDYATDDLPGAIGISVSLNPEDWKDPKKQTAKTLSSWAKATLGVDTKKSILSSDYWPDIKHEAEKRVWANLLTKDEEREPTKLEAKATKALGERTRQFVTREQDLELNRDRPFSLRNINVEFHNPDPTAKDGYKIDKKENVYKDTIEKILDFEERKEVNKSRDGLFDDVITKSAEAITTEVKAKKSEIERLLSEGPKTKREKDRLTFAKDILDKKGGAIEWMDLRSNAVKKINDIDKALEDITDNIQKSVLNVNRENKNDIFNMTASSSWEGLDKAISSARVTGAKNLVELEKAKTLLNDGKITQKAFNDFEKSMNKVNASLVDMESVVRDIKKGGMTRNAALRRLNSYRSNSGTRIKGGDIFQDSPGRRIIKSMDRDIKVSSPDALGDLLTDSSLRSADVDIQGRKLVAITERLRQERISKATEEFFDAAWDEKMSERYIWNNRIVPQFNVFTPDTFVSNALQRTNMLGLLVGDDFNPYIRFKSATKAARWAKRHAHTFDIKPDEFNLKVKKLKLVGGDHFGIVGVMGKINLNTPEDLELMQNLLKNVGTPGVSAYLQKLNDKGIKDPEEFLNIFLQGYKDKMEELAKELGMDDFKDTEFQTKFLKLLIKKDKELPGGYGVARNFVGTLDKIYLKLNNINNWFKGTALGKLLTATNNWKSFVSEKLATWITNLLGAAAATTGIMKVLWPIIKGFVKKVLEKAIDTGTAIIKGLVNLDFDKLFDVLNENTKKALVGCLLIMLPPTLFVSFIIYFVVILFGVTLPAADPTTKSDTIPIELNMALTFDLTLEQMLALGPAVLPELNLSASQIAEFAYYIASHLERGIWGAFNASDIPFYYDDTTKQVIIGESTSVGVELFWCTWLVVKSYQEVDPNFPVQLSSRSMVSVFDRGGQDGYSYSDREDITVDQINSGDVLFFADSNDATKGHVAIVYEVRGDSVITVESNSALVSYTLGTDDEGHLNANTPYSTGLVLEGVGQYEGNK